jgi:hypothetical protein
MSTAIKTSQIGGDDTLASTKVRASSANWDNTYSTVNVLSSTWNYQGTDLKALSANWQTSYNTVSSLSSKWNADYVPLSGGIVGGNLTVSGNLSTVNYTESVVAIGNSGTSQSISLVNGTFQTVTLTGNCTFTMPTATAGKSFILRVATGAGGFTAAFTGVKFSGGTAPTITAAASKYDLLSFVADGTAWSGSALQNFTA